MPNIIFEKWHGIGNDFVLIDNREQNLTIDQNFIRFLSIRNRGIGFDQLLLLNNSEVNKCDAAYRFFNPDGTEAEQCGNGQRCIAKYLHNQRPDQYSFCVSGLSGIIKSEIVKNDDVKVDMGCVTSIKKITLEQQELFYVDFGNPHLIFQHDDIESCNLEKLNHHYTKGFPNGINFEILEILSPSEIKLRVHERGTGETQACGSGACASVYALQQSGQLEQKVKVMLPGGNLVVEYNQQTKNLNLTGSATYVFSGEITV